MEKSKINKQNKLLRKPIFTIFFEIYVYFVIPSTRCGKYLIHPYSSFSVRCMYWKVLNLLIKFTSIDRNFRILEVFVNKDLKNLQPDSQFIYFSVGFVANKHYSRFFKPLCNIHLFPLYTIIIL
jgi:hypothetical protein